MSQVPEGLERAGLLPFVLGRNKAHGPVRCVDQEPLHRIRLRLVWVYEPDGKLSAAEREVRRPGLEPDPCHLAGEDCGQNGGPMLRSAGSPPLPERSGRDLEGDVS